MEEIKQPQNKRPGLVTGVCILLFILILIGMIMNIAALFVGTNPAIDANIELARMANLSESNPEAYAELLDLGEKAQPNSGQSIFGIVSALVLLISTIYIWKMRRVGLISYTAIVILGAIATAIFYTVEFSTLIIGLIFEAIVIGLLFTKFGSMT